MKLFITVNILLSTLYVGAQALLTPKSNTIEKKWITKTSYQMAWYAVKDSIKSEIGKIITDINVQGNKVIVVTNVNIKQNQSEWIDSTVANKNDLSPVYHSSQNAQRNMVLNFGPIVKGFYNSKINKHNAIINDTTSQGYFDSNLYPTLITWLPLQENYKQDISIYDYNPNSKTRVTKATIYDVKKGAFKTGKSGFRDVWIVFISDEIGGVENSLSIYYIDVADRRLWKQKIEGNGRTMELELIEN